VSAKKIQKVRRLEDQKLGSWEGENLRFQVSAIRGLRMEGVDFGF
jgi:hypothetical protein